MGCPQSTCGSPSVDTLSQASHTFAVASLCSEMSVDKIRTRARQAPDLDQVDMSTLSKGQAELRNRFDEGLETRMASLERLVEQHVTAVQQTVRDVAHQTREHTHNETMAERGPFQQISRDIPTAKANGLGRSECT